MSYIYTQKEKYIMTFFSVISHITTIPASLFARKRKDTFTYYLSIFGFLVSLFYHSTEYFDCEFILSSLKWHELDNIGVICSMNSILLSMSNLCFKINKLTLFNYISLFYTIILQQKNPWEINFTIIPCITFLFVTLINILWNGIPKYNIKNFYYGFLFVFIGLYFFRKGLDDQNDYLRLNHSLWHLFVGIFSFYLLQLQEDRTFSIKEVLYEQLNDIYINGIKF